ncbi:MAG TPA: glycosyltransferase [Desulfatiglandales bacterium]|nr:glycosyltransferase [Desulfatiglandales bacterium]
MKLLVVTNLYPTPKRPFISPFVKEQVEAMRENYPDMTIDVYVIEGWRPRWAYIRAMLLLPALVKKGRYDLVHAHFGLTLVSTLLVWVPVIITFHGSDLLVNPTKHVSKLLAPMTSKVIVVSQRLKASLGYGEVIPCGIDVKRFELPSRFENRPSPKMPAELRILFPADPGRKVKDYSLFRSVCRELERRGNKVTEVHLVNIKRENVPELYWNCDVMLLTSLSEGSPTVIKEAIAAKLPFVSVDVGDVKEWVGSVEFGVVVPDREPKTIADAVSAILARVEYRSSLDNSECVNAIDIKNLTKRVKNIYDEVLEKQELKG